MVKRPCLVRLVSDVYKRQILVPEQAIAITPREDNGIKMAAITGCKPPDTEQIIPIKLYIRLYPKLSKISLRILLATTNNSSSAYNFASRIIKSLAGVKMCIRDRGMKMEY